MAQHATRQTRTDDRPPRRLPLWVAVALSLALVGPTLAMAGNGQGIVGTVGKGMPLVFLIGLVGVALVGYGFIRLTRRLNHAGSVYALVGVVIGPRAGFFAGWAMLGAYVGFAVGLVGLITGFVNALLLELQNGRHDAFQVSWLVVTLVAVALAALLAARDTKLVGKILMVIEGVGILGMAVLVIVIFAKGGAQSTGVDFSAFSLGNGVDFSGVVTGVVAAFLSWAGFEACAALGEETDDPRRNIPRALAGTLALTGVLFVVVMFAQTIGFGTDAKGLAAFGSSGNTLGDLGTEYLNQPFGIVMIFAGVISAFACLLASASTAGRLLFAFARDGFGPARLAALDGPGRSPRNATWVVLGFVLLVNLLAWATGWPDLGSGNTSYDSYAMFATAGAVSLMAAYLMAEVAAVVFVTSARFRSIRQADGVDAGDSLGEGEGSRLLGVALPCLGFAFIALVLWYNVKGQHHPFSSPAYLGLTWAAVGLVGAVAARGVTRRMRTSLADELAISPAAVRKSQLKTP
ncbi:APC family permease [Streptomyces sp. NBC_00481]|uniref:APC family permease n=1 Tax=Streptomyces sp. NBC_00481 TaxID=2975755 RepID=UPI002DD9CD92|nr:APC family permease [Streptomyces sp. NBC_00481]WRZ00428.1 APC family permease [Streptomyces sp. NBC_00481]